MLIVTDLALRRGARLLLGGASFTLHAGARVGVVGANGSGKSTLFAALRGEFAPDAGDITLPAGTRIAHVAQETPALERSALDYVLDGDEPLRRVQAALAEAERSGDGPALARLHAEFEHLDGYTAPSRAARLLAGLGFAPEALGRPVSAFSGGWRMRLNLAQALMSPSDLLLLDEPTNHLDLEAILWLEDWLLAYRGTLLLISHDRDFLDRVVGQVLHLAEGRATLQTGNYSAFELRRAEQLAQQAAAHARQQREIARVREFVHRFGAKASKARQAQSRLKALARLEAVAPAHVDSPFRFAFPPPPRMPDPLLGLREVDVAYYGRVVLREVGLSLVPGDRVGLLGPNGAGKSSLIKVLAGTLAPARGSRTPAEQLRIGYFAQHQLEQLDPAATAYQHLLRLDRDASPQALRDFLGGFGFLGDEVFRPVESFSGGERARLVLALIVHQRPQLLLLDEPTNHLDLDMRFALELALQDFGGALVLISHDRHLMRTVVDRLLLVAEGRVREFDGDLDAYREWRVAREREQPSGPATAAEVGAAARQARKRAEAERRQQASPLRARVRDLERELEALGREGAELEARFADGALYGEARKAELEALLARQRRQQQALAEAEAAWLEASEALEALLAD